MDDAPLESNYEQFLTDKDESWEKYYPTYFNNNCTRINLQQFTAKMLMLHKIEATLHNGTKSVLPSFLLERNTHMFLVIVSICALFIFGLFVNIMSLVTLTRKSSASSLNIMLVATSTADCISLLMCLATIFFVYITNSYGDLQRYFEDDIFMKNLYICYEFLRRINIMWILSSASMFLMFILAVWKFIAVVFPYQVKIWCTMRHTFIAVILTYILSALIYNKYFTNLMCHIETDIRVYIIAYYPEENGKLNALYTKLNAFNTRKRRSISDDLVNVLKHRGYDSVTYRYFDYLSEFAFEDCPAATNFRELFPYAYANMILSLVPVILFTGANVSLIGALIIAKKERRDILGRRGQDQESKRNIRDSKITRTNRFIWVTLTLYWLTEVPTVWGKFNRRVRWSNSIPFENAVVLCYILSWTNSSFMFFINYFMSSNFRNTFNSIFLPKFFRSRRIRSPNKINSEATILSTKV